ncbi:hypothetical protein [Zavarzinia compransoris]|uniref:Uncharacterized protein n=1 Tax=Zavarzinia compransoris TaxID=1264899 RepID=A0A317E7D1_9PROT|nr:hypothetical protein [Zavarzinia compransoris]PWR20995.1 hypothetical protein DKG75_13490 [Zavarzinia compransoris]TDP44027.1 hypothetical protein DES42_10873 [Zavarzinia compransoris]
MSGQDYRIPTYPIVTFLVARGMVLAAVLGLVPLAASVLLALAGWPPLVVAGGAVASLVLGGLLASYVEVLRIIADTLMPK